MSNENHHAHNRNDLPVYNIKAISQLVGLLPVTIRAWERRYGLPTPRRGQQGYRLYSEYDLKTLRWLKAQIDAGMNISRAIEYLNELRKNGQDPAISPSSATFSIPSLITTPEVSNLRLEFLDKLLAFNELQATEVLRRAFSLYSVDQVLTEIITPVLVEIGERWHRGELSIPVEHFATQFVMQHLMSMMTVTSQPTRPKKIFAACAPGEMHQIGILMLVVMLRWRGWEVIYFGADLKLDRLEETLNSIQPELIMFTANNLQNALHLTELPSILHKVKGKKPLVVLGGQAFQSNRLPENVAAIYLTGMRPSEIVSRIEALLLSDEKIEKS